jgi:hypothetical protein
MLCAILFCLSLSGLIGGASYGLQLAVLRIVLASSEEFFIVQRE